MTKKIVGCLFIFCVWAISQTSYQRFEKVTVQQSENNADGVKKFEVWHDKESGQEFTCAFGTQGDWSQRPVSCWPTGRSWK